MPPIRLRDQFGFRPHLDLHHGSLLHLHRISELPTSDWSLSDNPRHCIAGSLAQLLQSRTAASRQALGELRKDIPLAEKRNLGAQLA